MLHPPVRFIEDFGVGHRFESGAIEVTQDAMVAFARQFDPQAMHTDPAAAASGFFGRLVASGWHTAALTMRLMVEARPFGAGGFVGVRVEDMRFTRPVEPGATLRAEAEILEIAAARGGYARAVLAVTTFADGEPALTQRWTILAPSRRQGSWQSGRWQLIDGPNESEPVQPRSIGVCPRCQYDLTGLRVQTCPECGGDIAAEFKRRQTPKRMWPIVIVWFLSTLGWGFSAWVLQMVDSKMGRHDPTTTAVRLAAAVSIVGLVVSAARRRALRTASRLAYWSVAAPGWILLIAFAIIWLLLLVALSAQ